ncbi:MAG: hypothetical protein PHQ52_07535 [Candidatus Omnitrophica bacterium]|nr:hypothetical protein [Candidatus Omnitrophota bacterium]
MNILQGKFFRIILLIVVVTFCFQQLDWLSDVYSLDNAIKRKDIEQITSYSADQVLQQHNESKNKILVIQSISDFDTHVLPEVAPVSLSEKFKRNSPRGISECLEFEKTLFSE